MRTEMESVMNLKLRVAQTSWLATMTKEPQKMMAHVKRLMLADFAAETVSIRTVMASVIVKKSSAVKTKWLATTMRPLQSRVSVHTQTVFANLAQVRPMALVRL